jgi:SAM-dependent MidA family methyltransferase
VTLRERIEQEIAQRGPLPFSRYMELCLYEPEMGYYSRHGEQFGKAGDFYTASDVHAVFGRLLARQFEEIWRVLGSPRDIEILELGPGRGLFARDVLDWSEKKFPELSGAVHYALYESSPALRERLRQILAQHLEKGKCSMVEAGLAPSSGAARHPSNAEWRPQTETGQAPSLPTPCIVFANEFFDALPVEVLSSKGKLHVGIHDGEFVETWAPPTAEELEYLDRYSVHPEPGERVEVNLAALSYMQEAAARARQAFVLVIDYGYTRDELLAGRHRGTVMTYRQHSASPNPYEAPGEQDITAHVNFTALAAAAEKQGMRTQKLVTQSQFLMGIGEVNQFADAFEDCKLPQERAKVALQLKHLVTPAGMGESFHVLVASKGVDPERVSQLAGLQFGRSRI